jgi:hypothetical protein
VFSISVVCPCDATSRGNPGVALTGLPIPGAGKGVFKNRSPYPTEDFFGNSIDLSRASPTIEAGNNAERLDCFL